MENKVLPEKYVNRAKLCYREKKIATQQNISAEQNIAVHLYLLTKKCTIKKIRKVFTKRDPTAFLVDPPNKIINLYPLNSFRVHIKGSNKVSICSKIHAGIKSDAKLTSKDMLQAMVEQQFTIPQNIIIICKYVRSTAVASIDVYLQ